MPAIPRYEQQYSPKMNGGATSVPLEDPVNTAISGLGATEMKVGQELAAWNLKKKAEDEKKQDARGMMQAAEILNNGKLQWQEHEQELRQNWEPGQESYDDVHEKNFGRFVQQMRRDVRARTGGNFAALNYFDANVSEFSLTTRTAARVFGEEAEAEAFNFRLNNQITQVIEGIENDPLSASSGFASVAELIGAHPSWSETQRSVALQDFQQQVDVTQINALCARDAQMCETWVVAVAGDSDGVNHRTGGTGGIGDAGRSIQEVGADSRADRTQDLLSGRDRRGGSKGSRGSEAAVAVGSEANAPVHDRSAEHEGGVSVQSSVEMDRTDHVDRQGRTRSVTVVNRNGLDDNAVASLQMLHLTPDQLATLRRVSGGDANKEWFLRTVLAIENRGHSEVNVSAESHAGALGPFQFMPSTAKALGFEHEEMVDFDKSAQAAAMLYDNMYRRYGDDAMAMFADYNGGVRAGQAVRDGRQAPSVQTRDYVNYACAVWGSRNRAQAGEGAGAVDGGVNEDSRGGGDERHENSTGNRFYLGDGRAYEISPDAPDALRRLSYDQQREFVRESVQAQDRRRTQELQRQRALERQQQNERAGVEQAFNSAMDRLMRGEADSFSFTQVDLRRIMGSQAAAQMIEQIDVARSGREVFERMKTLSPDEANKALVEWRTGLDMNDERHVAISQAVEVNFERYRQNVQADPVGHGFGVDVFGSGVVTSTDSVTSDDGQGHEENGESVNVLSNLTDSERLDTSVAAQRKGGIENPRYLSQKKAEEFRAMFYDRGRDEEIKAQLRRLQSLTRAQRDGYFNEVLGTDARGMDIRIIAQMDSSIRDRALDLMRIENIDTMRTRAFMQNDADYQSLSNAISNDPLLRGFLESLPPTTELYLLAQRTREITTRLVLDDMAERNIHPDSSRNRRGEYQPPSNIISQVVRAVVPQGDYLAMTTDSQRVRRVWIPPNSCINATEAIDGLNALTAYDIPFIAIDPNVRDDTGVRTPQELSSAWRSRVLTNAVWMTNDAGTGVYLVMIQDGVGQPIRVLSNGKPIERTWAQVQEARLEDVKRQEVSRQVESFISGRGSRDIDMTPDLWNRYLELEHLPESIPMPSAPDGFRLGGD